MMQFSSMVFLFTLPLLASPAVTRPPAMGRLWGRNTPAATAGTIGVPASRRALISRGAKAAMQTAATTRLGIIPTPTPITDLDFQRRAGLCGAESS